jgi:transcriptional regulator with GAF, ATPase, and Fis domain
VASRPRTGTGHVTLAQLGERHAREQRRLLLGALEGCGWSLTATARRLVVTLPRLQRLIVAHGLEGLYHERAPGPGRPRKVAT